MEKQFVNGIGRLFAIVTSLCFGFIFFGVNNSAWAEEETMMSTSSLAMSPMINKIILNPGESYTGSFDLTVPATANTPSHYEITLRNFYRDDNGNAIFEEINNTGRILNWTKIDSSVTGSIEPNSSKTIYYTIDVPEDAPAGGQYVIITASTTSDGSDNKGENQAIIEEKLALGHIVYAEVAGNTIHQGEILSADVPSFLLNGEISGSALIKNTGNSHGVATYTMQIYPLFSNEEIYTNEEDPETHTILPGLSFYNESYWDDTPNIGIFNVVYTVEFEGVTTQIRKVVIVCPIWLLFLIIFAIVALIIWIVMRVRARNKKSEKKTGKKPEE